MDVLSLFSPAAAAWFTAAFPGVTAAQRAAWPAIARGDHVLLVAPTGSGKTLSAFFWALDRLTTGPAPAGDGPAGVRVLYVSPLKALAVDVERNLRAPLVGLRSAAAARGEPLRPVRVSVRSGDTPADQRRAFQRDPGEILVTTPESLYLLLTSSAASALRTVEVVILDEVHVLAGTKRGVHLQVSLERLAALTGHDPQRVGLSATVRPLAVAAAFVGGDRAVTVLDTSEPPALDLRIVVPVDDMERPPVPEATALPAYAAVAPGDHSYPTNQPRGGMWPAIHPVLLGEIRSHRSTLIFTNSRLLCERTCRSLNELAGEEIARAHHGSVSHEQRAAIEEALKAGTLPALVATSSLELGIDMGAIDLVVLLASPGSAASGLQRVGRAGHQVGAVSSGRLFPKHRGDLLEAAVVASQMIAGQIEPTRMPLRCLDVLAQQVVAMVAVADQPVPALLATLRRAASYRDLSREALDRVLDLISGRWSGADLPDVTPTVTWDRATDTLRARRNTRLTAVLNGGTIPDRGLYRVRLGEGGPRLGELDEEMVYESRAGDFVVLGASTWRIEAIGRDEVIVSPAPGRPGRLPFWKGENQGRPVELGRAVGAFLRDVEQTLTNAEPGPDGRGAEVAGTARLQALAPLDDRAARNLLAYLAEQREATGALPTDRAVIIERFRDELGDWRVCLLSPFGARVHTPWSLAIEALLSRRTGFQVQTMASDDGIALRLADGEEPPGLDLLLPDPDEVEELVIEAVRTSSVFAGRFREAAARALLTPRRNLKGRRPLWLQRRRAEALLAAVSRFPSFPIVLETYREILQDLFDLPALVDLLRQLQRRELAVLEVETRRPSPFARSLVFQFVATWMYEGDAPLAERRALALALDRSLLAELLGQDGLRELLDPDAVAAVEAELQGTAEDRLADHPDRVVDLLRRVGALSTEELAARSTGDVEALLAPLRAERRVVALRIGGVERWVSVEEVAVWRDALGVALPGGLPLALLAPSEAPVETLVRRYARTHGPFTAGELGQRFGWTAAQAEVALRGLLAGGALVHGAFGAAGDAWCDAEVLRRIKRRSLARLRREVEPVSQAAWAAFLSAWHGLDRRRDGLGRLEEVAAQLEGAALPWSELEATILPARVDRYQPMLLDQLGAMGTLVWVGRGALGPRDGHVALHRREHLSALHQPAAAPPPDGPHHTAILGHLAARGASFLNELLRLGPPDEIASALADLAWRGFVTNDTFVALRGWSTGGAPSRLAGGRWSLVADSLESVSDTARLAALARALLERWGVVARDHAVFEEVPGGWTALYPVLAAMEEAGQVRRGWFIDGLGSAQFATAAAVERLRLHRDPPASATWLAACDPAQPWGGPLAWPATRNPEVRPRRVSGAKVALCGGQPALWLGAGGHLIVFDGGLDVLPAAIAALRSHVGWRALRLERIDGQPALASDLAPVLVSLGLGRDLKGLLLDRADPGIRT
jgi:ATP-dependent Lhr-like helicase